MARVPMVTRTVPVTHCNVMCLDVVSCEPFNKDVTLSGTFKDSEKMLKAVKAVAETENVKCVHIVDTSVEEILYGMTEQKFIELGEVLPPRPTRKNNEEHEKTNE